MNVKSNFCVKCNKHNTDIMTYKKGGAAKYSSLFVCQFDRFWSTVIRTALVLNLLLRDKNGLKTKDNVSTLTALWHEHGSVSRGSFANSWLYKVAVHAK